MKTNVRANENAMNIDDEEFIETSEHQWWKRLRPNEKQMGTRGKRMKRNEQQMKTDKNTWEPMEHQ